MKYILPFLHYKRTFLFAFAWSLTISICAQTEVQFFSGIASTAGMNASIGQGGSLSQPFGPMFSMDLDFLQCQTFQDAGVAVERATMKSLGTGLRLSPLAAKNHAIRPWVGAGVSWQVSSRHLDAQSVSGQTYHLWDDGLLYATPQPSPMPDVETLEPLVRDNVYETLLDRKTMLVVPVRAGLDLQLTQKIHATLAFAAIPQKGSTWTMGQVGIGMKLGGSAKGQVKTILSGELFGLNSDSDGDGVVDHKDKCGGTEVGAIVDKNGCAKDTDGDGVPDHRDLEINSPDLLVNKDGISISLEEWKALHAPTKGDPLTFAQDSMTIETELTAEQMAQALANAAYMEVYVPGMEKLKRTTERSTSSSPASSWAKEKVDASSGIVFRVQYGAFLEANAPDAASYTHETVTVLKTGHGLALHVGEARNTIESARQTLESAKALNHPDAFITAYQHGKRISIDEATAKQHNASDIVDEASHGNDISEGTGALDLSQIHFHVQLGRYSAGVPVEVLNRFLQMGHIIQRLESDGTHRYLTAPVHSEETARQNLAAAIDMGFDDAFLIAEINGEPATMAEAQEARAKQLALIANN
jgi:hypothetical protein